MTSLWDWISGQYAALGTTGDEIVKLALGPCVTLLIFALTFAIQIRESRKTRHTVIRNVIIGIYKEVIDNIYYAQKAELTNSSRDYIKQRIREEDQKALAAGQPSSYRPLIGITESSNFYDANASAVPNVKRMCLVRIAEYYRSVMDQKQAAQSIESAAFLCITVDSRCETIDELWQAFIESRTKAEACIKVLEASYPKSWFRGLGNPPPVKP